jgi:autotransporter-associated beta strand protein
VREFPSVKQKLLSSAILSVPLLMVPATAFADCLPNASGTIVVCNANDPDGYLAGDGVTINVNPTATVDGPLTVGIAGRVNIEGVVGNTGNSTVTTGGNSTVVNTRIATLNGAVVAGATAAGQVNTIENRGAFNAAITSSGALNLTNTYSGLDVGILNGAISSTGATSIANVGTLSQINGAIALGTGNDSIANDGAIVGAISFGGGTSSLTNAAGGTITGAISASGDTTIANGGTITGNITLGGGNDTITTTGTITGNIDLGGGTNTIGFGSMTALPSGTLTADAAGLNTINLFGSGADTLGIAVTNFDVLNKDGAGSWALTQPVVLADRININAGTLIASDADFLAGNRIINNATLNYSNAADGAYSGVLEGAGAVTVGGGGAGITTFSGANIYTGATTITQGTLRLTGGAAILDTGNVTVTAPGVLDIGAAETIGGLLGTGSVTLSGGALTVGSGNFTGAISGANGLVKNTTGTLLLGGANTYTGTTTVSNGTLTLAGGAAIADTGAIIVNAAAGPPATSGTLNVSAAETIGSLAGNGGSVALGAALTTGDATSTSYAGVISGTGSLVKQGAGVFTLTGANTYSGGTTIDAGTLAGAVGPLQGAILVNAAGTARFDQATAATFTGALSGAGIVNKEGAGVLTLSGSNIGHSGAFNINGGTVSIAAAANIGTGAISLTGTTLQTTGALSLANAISLNTPGGTISAGADTTLSGVISGAGSLTKTGSANLTLAGANTYAGGTTISAGTLTGTTTSLQGNIANNAALVLDQAAGGTYAGNISGTGTVSTTGAGAVTLSGTNTYSGATNVNAGMLVAGGTGIGDASAVTVASGATLQLAANEAVGSLAGAGALDTVGFTLTAGGNNGSTAFSGATTGAGLAKVGTGTMTLSGTGTLSGALTVGGGGLTVGVGGNYTAGSAAANSGTLAVGGTLTAPTTVASAATLDVLAGGTLAGSVTGAAGSATKINGTVTGPVANAGTLNGAGTINGTLTNSGTLRPGNSPGIITVNGAFVQTATGTLNAELTPVATAGTGYDQVRVAGTPGTATLAGTLALAPSTGLYASGSTYDVVLADGGITGAFSTITGNAISPFLSFANTGIVTVAGTQQAYRLTVTRTNYAAGLGAGATPNQLATANGLQAIVAGATGDAAVLVSSVDNLSAAQAQSFFDQASPESYGAYATAMQDQGELFTRQIALRSTGTDPSSTETGVWGRAFGQSGNGSNRSFRFGSDQDIYGAALGVDFKAGGILIGGVVGYSKADINYSLGNAGGSSKSWQAGVYGNRSWGKLDAGLQVAYVDGDFSSTKSIVAGAVNRVAAASFSGNLLKVIGTLGYNAGGENTTIRPFVGIDFASGKVKSFAETGAGAASLSVARIDADDTDLLVGVRLATKASGFTPYGRLAYRYQVDGPNRGITGSLNGNAGSAFTVSGVDPSKSQFDVDAGVSIAVGHGGTLFAAYQGSFRGDLTRHGGSVGIRFGF